MTAVVTPAVDQPFIRAQRDGDVVTLTLARGDRFNPLSSSMIAALQAALDETAADETARVVVLAGEGRGFSAGHDLKEMRSHVGDKTWQRALFDDCSRMMLTLTQMPQPVIARVHGIATAAGCQLVAMCDLAVAVDSAQFGLPGVNIGVFCSTPAVAVARNIGRKRSMELLLTGRTIDAQTALAWGLVNRVVPADQLDATVGELVELIRARSAVTISRGKRTFYEQIERPLETAYDVAGESMACNLLSEDAAEGIDAFLGKRSPQWKNR